MSPGCQFLVSLDRAVHLAESGQLEVKLIADSPVGIYIKINHRAVPLPLAHAAAALQQLPH